MPSSTKRESTVAMAAPTTPSRGKPSRPKISSELKTKLTTMAAMLAFIGSTVSPRLSQGPRDALRNGEGDKPHHHNVHVFPARSQRRGRRPARFVSLAM